MFFFFLFFFLMFRRPPRSTRTDTLFPYTTLFRHVVVVEDDDQPVARLLGIVHRLIRHARRHRAVADDGDRLAGPVGELVRHREAQRRRDRGRRMRRAERVVVARSDESSGGKECVSTFRSRWSPYP